MGAGEAVVRIADGVFWMAERGADKLALRMANSYHGQDLSSGMGLSIERDMLPGDVTFRDLAAQVLSLGRFFRGLGGRPGDIVALYLDNSPSFLAVFLGLAHAGFIVAPLNTRLTRGETDAILADMRPWRVVTEQDGQFVARQGLDVGADDVELHLEAVADTLSSDTSSAELDAGLSDTDMFYLGYSSGTTGRPKGLLRTHKSWTESFFGMTLEFGLNTETVLLVPGPLCYSASLIAALHVLFIGGTVFVEPAFDPAATASLLSSPASPVSAVFMVPAMYGAVLEAHERSGIGTRSSATSTIGASPMSSKPKPLTCVTCGDKMPQDLYARFIHAFQGARVFEYYGSSEVGFVSVHDFESGREETVGQPFFPVRVRTVEGEIQVKSGLGFSSYVGEATGQADRVKRPAGWLAPGDHGRILDGWLHVTGRSSDLIVRGGVNLYPAEIESVVRAFPGVVDTAVFGVPDDRLGEVPVCAVVWRDGAGGGAEQELAVHLRETLAGYKQPHAFVNLPRLPRNSAGKVDRMVLRRDYEGRLRR